MRIRAGNRVVEEAALLNSSFKAPTPQLLIPISTARALGLWPPSEDAREGLIRLVGH